MIFIGEGTINRSKRLILKYIRMIAMIQQVSAIAGLYQLQKDLKMNCGLLPMVVV